MIVETLYDPKKQLRILLTHRDDSLRSSRNYRIAVDFSAMMHKAHDFRWSEAERHAQNYMQLLRANLVLPEDAIFEAIPPESNSTTIEIAVALPDRIPGLSGPTPSDVKIEEFMKEKLASAHVSALAALLSSGKHISALSKLESGTFPSRAN